MAALPAPRMLWPKLRELRFTPKMARRFCRCRRTTTRIPVPKMEDLQALTSDDQKHGAEDGGPAGDGARRSEARRRRWMLQTR